MKRKHIRPEQIIIFGFMGVILVGTLLLMLPISRTGDCSFIDALFTATSATCVTGLVTKNTASFWSEFGHVIILMLIQIGGLGVITFAILLGGMGGKKIGLSQRTLMKDAINAPQVGGIVRLTHFLVRGVVLIELIGAIILSVVFVKDYGVGKGIWYGVFHSISAFCNGGFDIISTPDMPGSLITYAYNPVLVLTICLLILIGGIGFLTWSDIVNHKFHLRKYSLQSKIVLTVSLVLVVFPVILFMLTEWQDLDGSKRFLVSLFQTVTLRTAGFNTIDFNTTSEAGLLLMILLMLVGGATGSTAGGMKMNTFALVVLATKSIFMRRNEVACFGRRIENSIVMNALAIFVMYISLFLIGGLLLSMIEGYPILTCLFESASAIATVGVTMGITSSLHTASKIILIILMFLGRVGGLTFIYATLSNSKKYASLPHENVSVG